MSIEQTIVALTEALLANTAQLAIVAANQERLIAGQDQAIAKVEPAKRTRAKKDEPAAAQPEGNAEPAVTESPAAAATTAAEPTPPAAPEVTADDLKATASGWLGGTNEQSERRARGDFLMSMTKHFGSPKLTGPEATLDADQIKKAVFYVKRKAAGLSVDFAAEYDFDGDPEQEFEASDDDLLG